MTPPGNDEHDVGLGYGRTQPEFSLGERLAAMEANERKDDEHSKQIAELEEKLVIEKLTSVRQEMTTKDVAQKEATTKAEKSAADTASALATELKSSRETTDARLGAIERGGAGLSGEKLGSGDSRVLLFAIVALLLVVGQIIAALAAGHVI